MNYVKKKSVVYSESNQKNDYLHFSTPLKKLSKKDFEMDLKIKHLANEINQKLIEGKNREQISLKDKNDIYEIISFILDKNALYENYLLILNQFLYSFYFLEIFSLPESFINKNDLINNISLTLKKEQINANKMIYINGQLGKKFYIILEGKVTIIEPILFYVKASYQQFYEYLEFLLSNNEYELIRLIFDSNKKNVNEKIKFFKDKYYKFNELLDRNFISDIKNDYIDEKSYVNKYDSFINETFGENSILTEDQLNIHKIIEEKEEEEEEIKQKEIEELENLEDEPSRRITGIDAENDKYEILDKIRQKKRESIKSLQMKKPKKRKDKFKLFYLWKYKSKNIVLNYGDSFGEIALKKNDNKIKSTIITKTDCLFCILERDEYRNLISEYIDNARKINVNSLMHSKLFHNYNADLFNIHYFSFFTPIKKSKGDYLFRQKEKRKNIYFIKNGGVNIEYYASWNDLEKILDVLNEQTFRIKKNYNIIGNPNETFESFIQKKQKFNIFNYFNGEIAGTNEILYPNTDIFMFDAICTSECEIFSLKVKNLNDIINEKIIRKNYNELNTIKKEKLIQRLINLKSNVIFQYNRMVNSENKQQIIEKKVKKNNSNLFDKTINKRSLKNNFFISSTDIIKNHEKKNKNTRFPSYKLKTPRLMTFKNITRDDEINIYKSRDKQYKLLGSKNMSAEYLKTEKINKNRRSQKVFIHFSLKGKVPKLLLNKANTVNKVIDQLITKEKDLFNLNNSIYSKSNSKRLINHLDILSFDNYMNKIEMNIKTNREENSKEKPKKINKLLLSPVLLKKRKNSNFSNNRKISFRKNIIF